MKPSSSWVRFSPSAEFDLCDSRICHENSDSNFQEIWIEKDLGRSDPVVLPGLGRVVSLILERWYWKMMIWITWMRRELWLVSREQENSTDFFWHWDQFSDQGSASSGPAKIRIQYLIAYARPLIGRRSFLTYSMTADDHKQNILCSISIHTIGNSDTKCWGEHKMNRVILGPSSVLFQLSFGCGSNKLLNKLCKRIQRHARERKYETPEFVHVCLQIAQHIVVQVIRVVRK